MGRQRPMMLGNMNKVKLAFPSALLVSIPLIAILVSVLPLLVGGFGAGHDYLLELVRVAEYRHALMSGQMPPFWAANLYGGFGSPIFLYYAPLYAAIAAALEPLIGSIKGAASATIVLFSITGALLMWRLLRNVCPESPTAARIAVVLYALHPYLLADKWIRNANAEFVALSLLPGVLTGATARGSRSAFWWTSLSLSGVILAHNITALVATILAIAISLLVRRSLRAVIPVCWGVLAALALTAFFWIPALVLQPLIHSEALVTGKFDFHLQFPDFTSLFWPRAFYSGGWLTAILFVGILFMSVADLRAKRIARALGIAAVIFIFLMLRASTRVWETLPLLRYEQFPWRFMGPLAVSLAAGAGIVSTRLSQRVPSWCLELTILAAALFNAYPALRAYRPLAPDVRAAIEQVLTPEGIKTNNLRTTAYDEYLPRGANLDEVHHEEGEVLFRRWAFPIWSATADGKPIPVVRGPGGVAAVRVSSGAHQLSLILVEPPIRKAGKVLSGLTAAILLGAGVAFNRRRKKRNGDNRSSSSR